MKKGEQKLLYISPLQLPASHFRSPEPPRYSVDEILGIAQADVRQPMEAREIIARIVDGSSAALKQLEKNAQTAFVILLIRFSFRRVE